MYNDAPITTYTGVTISHDGSIVLLVMRSDAGGEVIGVGQLHSLLFLFSCSHSSSAPQVNHSSVDSTTPVDGTVRLSCIDSALYSPQFPITGPLLSHHINTEFIVESPQLLGLKHHSHVHHLSREQSP